MKTVIETPMFLRYASKVWSVMNETLSEFGQDLLESIRQARRGEYARVSTPEDILARRRGRPAGSRKAAPKVQTAIRFDPDVLSGLRALGRGWQTRANDALREWLKTRAACSRKSCPQLPAPRPCRSSR